MSIAIAIWSIALLPGKPQEVSLESDVRITNAALGAELKDDGRTSIKLSYARPIAPDDEDDDEDDAPPSIKTTVLCSLTPGKIEQATVDLVLEGDEDYLFEVVGKNTVYLTGNYIDQAPFNGSFNGSSIADSDEEAYDLREVSSDVEVDPEELESDPERFEELDELEEPIKTLKRPRESDAMDTDASPAAATKKETEKLSKKLKGEGGKAVAAGPEADSKPSAEGETKKDKKKKKKEKKKDQDATADGTEKQTEILKKAAGSVKTLAGGLQVKDAKVGTGSQAKKGNSLKLRYVGKLSNGTIFDKNTKGPPFKVQLGKGDVIKGWEEGLVGMQVGGERVLTVPPSMAYGEKKMGNIPANATLTFEIKLLEIN